MKLKLELLESMAVAVLNVEYAVLVSDIKKGAAFVDSDQAPERALSRQLHAAPYRRTVVNPA